MARILVTEDDDSVRAFVARALTLDGHDIDTAEDGADALDRLRASSGRFDLLLSDIRMPMMDGIALAIEVAPQFPDIAILLMTGFADQRERADGLDRIVHDVVPKPFSLSQIRAAVVGALAAGRERAACPA